MKIRKSDWQIVKEAEIQGFMCAMTPIVEAKRTPLNEELSDYFKEKIANWLGVWEDDEAEAILERINKYLEENNIKKGPLDFPIDDSDSDIHLIPINENIQLKILISKGIVIDFFLINEKTKKEDVDELVNFVKKYLTTL